MQNFVYISFLYILCSYIVTVIFLKLYCSNIFLSSGSALSDNSNYDAACHGGKPAKMWDPPLLYDLNLDPGERHPVETDSAIYRLGVKIGSNTLIV